MQSWFQFVLDGDACRVEKEDTLGSLASFLARLDQCFARFGEDASRTGGHLVVVGDLERESHRFRVVDAQTLLLPMVADQHVWTPEGIRQAEPDHPVNLALQKGHFECGSRRTDALVALMFEGYYRPDLRRRGQISDQFDAVVTRSANIPAIREAATEVFASTEQLRQEAALKAQRTGDESTIWTGKKDIFGDRFTRSLFQIRKKSPFSYVDERKRRFHRPNHLVELFRLLKEYPEAHVVAGGTGLARQGIDQEWPHLISLEGVGELQEFTTNEENWRIGAAIPLTEIAERIGRECQPFNKVMRRFGSRAVRNRATLGGYLATAWSAGQISPLLLALNARVHLLSPDGERDAPISGFFTENGGTILQPNEIIRCIVIPRATASLLAARGISSRLCDAYIVGPRRTLCQPYASAAFAVELRDSNIIKAWIAYSGIQDHPVRAREAEQFLAGKTWNENTLFETLPILNETIDVSDARDQIASSDYRKQLVVTLFQKFFFQHSHSHQVSPLTLSMTGEFAQLDEPFFGATSE
ncbi:MAG: FAD binding domain-containing protein [Verrucomicrobiota bacterium]